MKTYLVFSSEFYCRILKQNKIPTGPPYKDGEVIRNETIKILFHKLPKKGEVFEITKKANIRIVKRNV